MLNKMIDIGIFSILFFNAMILFKSPFEFYVNYIPLLILLVIFSFKYRFPTKILYLFIPILLFGLINIYFENNTAAEFFKIYINVFIAVLFFYYVFEYYERDVSRFFTLYMQFCIVASIVCIIQLVSYKIGFRYGYDYSLLGLNKWGIVPGSVLGIRINGFFSEASYLASTLGAAFFIALYNIIVRKNYFISKNASILILVTYLLTFSSVAYLGIFFTIILLLINFGFVRYVVFIIPILLTLFFVLYNNVDEFKVRMDGINELYFNDVLETEKDKTNEKNMKQQYKKKINVLGKIHGSSFVLFNNYVVAKENFYSNPIFGTGLGSHGHAYDKYNLNQFMGNEYKFNTADANSMFLRLMSETGLFGLIFMFLFIRNNYVKKQVDFDTETNEPLWLISNAVLVIILLQLARQGNYTFSGFMAYMWLYYYVGKQQQETISVNETEKVNLPSTNEHNFKTITN